MSTPIDWDKVELEAEMIHAELLEALANPQKWRWQRGWTFCKENSLSITLNGERWAIYFTLCEKGEGGKTLHIEVRQHGTNDIRKTTYESGITGNKREIIYETVHLTVVPGL